jgi:DNA polymerase-3 subunit delta
MNVARYDVSDLRDALKARDTVRAARTLEGLKAEDAAPPLVLWALANEARNGAASSKIAALLHAAKIDRMIKGLARGDIWDEFLQLAMRLTRSRST